MADQDDRIQPWLEAVALPLLAAAANYSLETVFPSIESPIFPFLALVFVTLRHPDRFAWRRERRRSNACCCKASPLPSPSRSTARSS